MDPTEAIQISRRKSSRKQQTTIRQLQNLLGQSLVRTEPFPPTASSLASIPTKDRKFHTQRRIPANTRHQQKPDVRTFKSQAVLSISGSENQPRTTSQTSTAASTISTAMSKTFISVLPIYTSESSGAIHTATRHISRTGDAIAVFEMG